MAPHRKRIPKDTIIARYVAVQTWHASVGAHTRIHREVVAPRFLTFEGALDSPLHGHEEVELMISAHLDAFVPVEGYPASVGSLVGNEPRPVFVFDAFPDDLNRMLILAASGQVRSIHIAMTKPMRGRARLVGYEIQSRNRKEEEWAANAGHRGLEEVTGSHGGTERLTKKT